VFENPTSKQGVLFFREGELIDARSDGLKGEEAAHEIFMWDEVTLSIQNVCPQKEKKIHRELQAILLDAMRLKDEVGQKKDAHVAIGQAQAESIDTLSDIKGKIEKEIGERSGVQDIYKDSSWDGFVGKASKLGVVFDMGKLKVTYVDRGESNDYILLPDEVTTVISVSTNSPRDRIIQVLSE
jgi:hypothetical protein